MDANQYFEGGALTSLTSELSQAIMDAQIRTEEISKGLPDLPTIIRYYDDLLGEKLTIRNLETLDVLEMVNSAPIRFDGLGHGYKKLLKHAFYYYLMKLSRHTAQASASKWIIFDRELPGLLTSFAGLEFKYAKVIWDTLIFPRITHSSDGNCIRSLLRYFADVGIGEWNSSYKSWIANLSNVKSNAFQAVRDQSTFIPISDQHKIIHFLNYSARRASSRTMHRIELEEAAVLAMAFSYGVRPIQMALMTPNDITLTNHEQTRLRYPWRKQKNDLKSRWKIQRVKSEWSPIFEHLQKERLLRPVTRSGIHRLLFEKTQRDIGILLRGAAEWACDIPYSANNFRHTSHQRMADAGYSMEEIAEAHCQSVPEVSLVYIENAASEAEIVNRALGLSTVYSAVLEVAKTKTIDKQKLMGIPEEKQISGMPHGVPIAGLGACTRGQGNCEWNPVTSGYSCVDFIAVDDPELHREVAHGLREVVMDFHRAAKGDSANPAFTQLRDVIEMAELWADTLSNKHADLDHKTLNSMSLKELVDEAKKEASDMTKNLGHHE